MSLKIEIELLYFLAPPSPMAPSSSRSRRGHMVFRHVRSFGGIVGQQSSDSDEAAPSSSTSIGPHTDDYLRAHSYLQNVAIRVADIFHATFPQGVDAFVTSLFDAELWSMGYNGMSVSEARYLFNLLSADFGVRQPITEEDFEQEGDGDEDEWEEFSS